MTKMQSTKSSLKRLALSKPPDEETRPAAWVCDVCAHVIAPLWSLWEGRWIEHTGDCPKCAALELGLRVLEDRRAALLEKYHLSSGEYGQMTFENYQPGNASQSQALATAKETVTAWQQGDWTRGVLFQSGSVGIGKTHLAIAMARAGVMLYTPQSLGDHILTIWDMPSYIAAIKASYDGGGTEAIQKSVQRPALLLMDDLGAEYVAGMDWYRGLLYDIVNARWLKRKTTIVTTNLTTSQLQARLGKRAFSRLIALTGKPVQMTGDDYRLRDL